MTQNTLQKLAVVTAVAALLGIGTICAKSAQVAEAATLVADYQFNNTLASSIDGAPSLFDLGTISSFSTETVDEQSITVFNFAVGGDQFKGLQLYTTDLIPTDNYSVVALFNFDTVQGWRKILDINNRLTDAGLYNLDSKLAYFGKKETASEGTEVSIGLDQWV